MALPEWGAPIFYMYTCAQKAVFAAMIDAKRPQSPSVSSADTFLPEEGFRYP